MLNLGIDIEKQINLRNYMLYCTNDFVAHKIFCVNREKVKCP